MMDPKLKMDVPPQVREFAQKSVDQADRCCGADTDMSERARAYSKVHSKIDRAASRERSAPNVLLPDRAQ